MTEYAATTSNATNKVTATPTDEDATVVILLNGEEIDNESSAEWDEGENELEITVSRADTPETHFVPTTYTVAVTKETEQEGDS